MARKRDNNKELSKNKKIVLTITAITTLILFIIMMLLVITNNISWFDDSIYNFIFGFRSNILDTILKTLTYSGNTIPMLCIVIILAVFLNREERIILGSSTILTVGLNQIIKHIIARPRPNHLRLIKQGGYSFPSGHSMIALCVYGIMIYLVNKNIKNKKLRVFLTVLLTLMILTIGISRIYVGVHYPSDVVGGYLLTISILLINIVYKNKIYGGILNGKDGNN